MADNERKAAWIAELPGYSLDELLDELIQLSRQNKFGSDEGQMGYIREEIAQRIR